MVERKKFPPIKDKIIKPITDAIDRMEQKQLALARQPFTASDLLKLFIPPDLHAPLRLAYQLCEPSGHTQDLFVHLPLGPEYDAVSVHVRFYWHGSNVPDGFYVPYLGGAQMQTPAVIQSGAPPELVERFRQISHDMVDTTFNFAKVRTVFDRLNHPSVCPSLAALRYHWPCIVPILRMARYTTLADEVQDPYVRAGDSAKLTPFLRKWLGPTNQIVAGYLLVDDVPLPPASPISYQLRHNFK